MRWGTLAAQWKKSAANVPRLALQEETMFQSRIAEWSYYLGCVSAAVTIVYRALLLADPRLFSAPRVVPHHFLELSILLFVVSIASTTRATDRLGEGKVAAAGRAV
jgi:hypothetical protein